MIRRRRLMGTYRTAGQSDYARALYIGAGTLPEDARTRPKIAIMSSTDDSTAGHVHLGRLTQIVKDAVYEAGAQAYVSHIPAGCDGVAQGEGMHWSLLSRDLGAGAVEAKVQMHQFDALVCISSCDKIIPAMLMACARIDIPTIFVTGGLMATYCSDAIPGRREVGTSDIKEAHQAEPRRVRGHHRKHLRHPGWVQHDGHGHDHGAGHRGVGNVPAGQQHDAGHPAGPAG